MALMTVDFPLEVRPKKATFMWSLARTSLMPLIFPAKSEIESIESPVNTSGFNTFNSWRNRWVSRL